MLSPTEILAPVTTAFDLDKALELTKIFIVDASQPETYVVLVLCSSMVNT